MELTGNRLMLPPELRNEMLDALSNCDVALRGTIHPRIQIENFSMRSLSPEDAMVWRCNRRARQD